MGKLLVNNHQRLDRGYKSPQYREAERPFQVARRLGSLSANALHFERIDELSMVYLACLHM